MSLMEQEFALLYSIPGITDVGLWQRTQRERVWLLKKLNETKRQEAEKIANAQTAPTVK